MTNLINESMAGSNGASWPAVFVLGANGSSGGLADIQSNTGRLLSGASSSNSSTYATSRRYDGTTADLDITFTMRVDAEAYPRLYMRADRSDLDRAQVNGYHVSLYYDGFGLRFGKTVAGSSTTLQTLAGFTPSFGSTWNIRFQAIGNAFKLKYWQGTEPGTWNMETTDSTFTSAGYFGWQQNATGVASTSKAVYLSNIVATDGQSGVVSVADSVSVVDAITVQADLPMADTVTASEAFDVLQLQPEQVETVGAVDAMTVEVFQLHHDLRCYAEWTPGEWTDLTSRIKADVESYGTFGRPTRWSDVAASTWTITLDNSDGALTPGNPGSPWYPHVEKGISFRTEVEYSGQTYPRHYGRITGISVPAFTDPEQAVAVIRSADIMATLDRKDLTSTWTEESRRQARNVAAGCDVFPFPASSVSTDTSVQAASTTFENKGIPFTGSTRMGTVTVMPAANGAGVVKSTGASSSGGALSEGQLEFTPADNGFGAQAAPILVCKPQVGFQSFEMLFKFSTDDLPPDGATDDTEWILADFWAGSTEAFRVVAGRLNGVTALAVKLPAGGAQYIYEQRLNDDRWRKLTIWRSDPDAIRLNVNDAPSGAEQTLAVDLTEVTTVYVGGRANPTTAQGKQVQCLPCAIGGIACQQEVVGVDFWYVVGAPPANVTASQRFLELISYAHPVTFPAGLRWHASLPSDPFAARVTRTSVAGRSVLSCLQELARTVGAYLWVEPDTGTLTIRRGPNSPSVVSALDLVDDADDADPPEWRDSVDVQPTRVTARCPAGEATSINTAAESAGQYQAATVETCAATVAAARSVADRYVTGQATLHLANLGLDLVHAKTSLWGVLLPGLLPGECALRVTSVPAAVFGVEQLDATVESWRESYTIDTAAMTFETTPPVTISSPPLGSFTTTASVGTQTEGTVTVPQPAATSAGALLAAIMTTDHTGALDAMAAPGPEWTLQASGSGDAGHGKMWTKTAGASEPPVYTFTAVGSSGGPTVLVADGFDGTNGAALDSAKWSSGYGTTGAAATIQDGAARLDPGSVTGYGGRCSIIPTMPDKADVEMVLSFKVANLDTFPAFIIRATEADNGEIKNGYEFRPNISSQGARLARLVNYTNTVNLGFIGGQLTAGTWYRIRFQTSGSTIRVRMWPAASAEPSSWGVEATDTHWTAAGPITIAVAGGNAAGSHLFIDDVVISDPEAVTGFPEAKVTMLRVVGAHSTSPFVSSAEWSADASATVDHAVTAPAPSVRGLLVHHWHILGTETGGGGGTPGGSTVTWPIKVAADGHHLQDSAGRPFLYCADTGWQTVARLTLADAQTYIDNKVGQGFNALQASLTVWGRDNAGDKGAPFVGTDMTQPNESYWAVVDQILDYALSKQMLVVLWPIWAASNGGWDAELGGPSSSEFAAYCTWLANRYGSQPNIAWAMGGDEQYEQVSSWMQAGIDALEAGDPGHIKTWHPRWDNYNLAGSSWLDWNSTQWNNNQAPMTYELARTGYQHSSGKPYLLSEPPYVPDTAVGGISTSNHRNRCNGWWAILGGAMGVVYGGARYGTWNIGGDGNYDWTANVHVSGFHTGRIRVILEQYPWSKMAPDWGGSVVTSSRGSYGSTSYVMVGRATDGSMICVYAPSGGNITVAMTQLSEASGWARWYDPASGALIGAPIAVTNTGSRTFTPPSSTNSAGDADWVLILAGTSVGPGAGGTPGGGGTVSGFAFGASGFGSPAQITRFNDWLTNKSLKAIGIWSDNSPTRQETAEGLGTSEELGSWSQIVDLAIGGVFGSETWAQAAAGDFDTRWTTSLNTIKTKWGSRPPGNLFLRFAHEFNGDWSDWYVTSSNAAAFVTAWQRWANLCRSILPGVQICWSPNDGFSGGAAGIDSVWPGSAYVDIVGPDTYNAWPHASTLAEWQAKMQRVDGSGNPEGMEVWRQWAASKGKPLAIPEWGNRVYNLDGGGGGDHPVYVTEMIKWFKQHAGSGPGQVRYAIYFNHGPNQGYDVDYLVWDDGGALGTVHQPLTAAALRAEA